MVKRAVMQLICQEEHLLNTISPKATEYIFQGTKYISPCTDNIDCIVVQIDFADSKVKDVIPLN
jgi:hypothetical protein